MNVKFANSFLSSTFNVFPQFGITDIKKNGVSIKESKIESFGVMVILGIVGDFKGNVIYSTTSEAAMSIASAMMMGAPVPALDDIAQSAIAELTNMLTATAATCLFTEGISVNISTPALMQGDFIANINSNKTICIEMLVNNMPFEISIYAEINK